MIKGTELSVEHIELIYQDVANGVKSYKIMKKYSIGYDRYLNITNKGCNKIDEYRQKLALAVQKDFIPKALLKRNEILDSIDGKDIKGAKLASKTAAIHDLTIDKRLEAGLSTDNIAIISKDLTDEQLRDFILNGVNDINKPIVVNENNIVNEKQSNNSI